MPFAKSLLKHTPSWRDQLLSNQLLSNLEADIAGSFSYFVRTWPSLVWYMALGFKFIFFYRHFFLSFSTGNHGRNGGRRYTWRGVVGR